MPYSALVIRAKLEATRDALINTRLTVVSQPRPSYNIDGQTVEWEKYLGMLNKSIAAITQELNEDDGIIEGVTVGYAGP